MNLVALQYRTIAFRASAISAYFNGTLSLIFLSMQTPLLVPTTLNLDANKIDKLRNIDGLLEFVIVSGHPTSVCSEPAESRVSVRNKDPEGRFLITRTDGGFFVECHYSFTVAQTDLDQNLFFDDAKRDKLAKIKEATEFLSLLGNEPIFEIGSGSHPFFLNIVDRGYKQYSITSRGPQRGFDVLITNIL